MGGESLESLPDHGLRLYQERCLQDVLHHVVIFDVKDQSTLQCLEGNAGLDWNRSLGQEIILLHNTPECHALLRSPIGAMVSSLVERGFEPQIHRISRVLAWLEGNQDTWRIVCIRFDIESLPGARQTRASTRRS